MGIHWCHHRSRGGGGLVIGEFYPFETEWEEGRGVKKALMSFEGMEYLGCYRSA
jgi:hypothetical protein